jgi:hypothetical protein
MLPHADKSTKALNCRNLAICTTATMHLFSHGSVHVAQASPGSRRFDISPPSLLHIRVDDASAPTTALDWNKVTPSSAVPFATPLLANALQKRGRHLSPLRRGRQRPPRGVGRRSARNLWLGQVGVALERKCRRGARNSVGRRQIKELPGEQAAQSASEQAQRVDCGRKIARDNTQGEGCVFGCLAVLESQQPAQ